MSERRRAFVHVGTHKTGTTSIQSFLAENAEAFAAAGLHIPATGRTNSGFAGHHNIAWELLGYPDFDAARGTLADLLAEIRERQAPTVCLSSEEFEFIHLRPKLLLPLTDGLIDAGYTVHVILYLRPQVDYLESLYAELCRRGFPFVFDEYLQIIATTSFFGRSQFNYRKLAEAFRSIVGRDRLHLRVYDASAPNEKLLREFVDLLGLTKRVTLRELALPPRLNVNAGAPAELTLRDIIALSWRFFGANLALRTSYGVMLAPVTRARLRRAIAQARRS